MSRRTKAPPPNDIPHRGGSYRRGRDGRWIDEYELTEQARENTRAKGGQRRRGSTQADAAANCCVDETDTNQPET